MTKKRLIDKELYIVNGTNQATMGQIGKGLGQNSHTLGQNRPRFSYSIDLYILLSLSSSSIKEEYKIYIVLRKGYRELRILFQRRKFVQKFGPPRKLYNIAKKQLFSSIKDVYNEKGGLFCPKVAKKRLGQAK